MPGNPQSWNRYIYVGNNPLFWVDPTGLIWGKNEEGKVRWFDKDLGEGFEEFRPENWQYVGRNGRIVQLDPNSSNWSYIDPVEIVAESDPIVDLIQSAGGALDDSLTGLQIGARNTGTELINTLTNPLGIAGAAAGVPNPFEIAPLEPANSHQAAYAIIAEFGITAMASAGAGSALAGPASAGSSLSVVPETQQMSRGAQIVIEWLGREARPVRSSSDLMIRSADGTRTIRFDLVNSHGDLPHINVQTWRNTPRGWIETTPNSHIYPRWK